jgi:hypothetical protein
MVCEKIQTVILVRATQDSTSSKEGWGLYYSHHSDYSKGLQAHREREVTKSLEMTEASAISKTEWRSERSSACVVDVVPGGTIALFIHEEECLQWSRVLYSKERCTVVRKPIWRRTVLLTCACWFPVESQGRDRGVVRTLELLRERWK